MITYEGLDLLGKLVAGVGTKFNTMYLEFTNEDSAPTVVPDPADGRSYYAALEAPGNTKDYIRVPLVADPVLSSSDAGKFDTNKVSCLAMSTGVSAGRGGHAFSSAAPSLVFGVALVAAPDPDDASQDIVFARSYDFAEKEKLPSEEVSVQLSEIFSESMII
jgi:hypothetical protein